MSMGPPRGGRGAALRQKLELMKAAKEEAERTAAAAEAQRYSRFHK